MTANIDFIEMFHELGLSANCSLDDFKRAYRRCVAQLHPDRVANRTADHSRLQRLTVTYEAALDFHKRHGRLPGDATRAPPARPARAGEPATATPERPLRRSRLRWLLVAVGIVVLIWLLWDVPASVDEETDEPQQVAATEADARAPVADPAPARLAIGMTKDQVRAIEGEPVAASESQWLYGPSWIAFKCGEVETWYSSPMRPLRFAHAHPTVFDLALAPKGHSEPCANLGAAR